MLAIIPRWRSSPDKDQGFRYQELTDDREEDQDEDDQDESDSPTFTDFVCVALMLIALVLCYALVGYPFTLFWSGCPQSDCKRESAERTSDDIHGEDGGTLAK